MYLQLYQIKKHLNIDEDFHLDDEYLVDLSVVAQQVIQKHIDNNLDELCVDNGGELPSPLLHAMLLLIGNFYANRESVAFASSSEIPLSYEYLLSLYKNYNNINKNS